MKLLNIVDFYYAGKSNKKYIQGDYNLNNYNRDERCSDIELDYI